jgi:hypothetical protein
MTIAQNSRIIDSTNGRHYFAVFYEVVGEQTLFGRKLEGREWVTLRAINAERAMVKFEEWCRSEDIDEAVRVTALLDCGVGKPIDCNEDIPGHLRVEDC